jgi:hypothetical protein
MTMGGGGGLIFINLHGRYVFFIKASVHKQPSQVPYWYRTMGSLGGYW